MKKETLIGSHLSISGGFWKALVRAHTIGATCVQIFTKSNRQWAAKPITDEDIQKFISTQKKLGIKKVVAHASYLINLGSESKEVQEKSIKALAHEIERCEQLFIPYLVLHPGSNSSKSTAETCKQIGLSLNKALSEGSAKKTMVLLETMAGQGSTVGKTFEDLADILSYVVNKKHVGVCVDTCHIFAAGYKFDDKDSYKSMWDNFDKVIGLNMIKVIHINDSKKEFNSNVDRHEHIGKGKIGTASFKLIMNDKHFANTVKIIETPNADQDLKHDEENLNRLKSYITE